LALGLKRNAPRRLYLNWEASFRDLIESATSERVKSHPPAL
jgi:hypothetical protein